MPSVSSITKPASNALGLALPLMGVNPIVGGIAAGVVGLVGLVDKIGQGRRAANKMTENGGPQDIINKQLAAISGSGASAEEKAQATDYAWQQFLQATNQFASQGPTYAKVANQAIYKTPGLTNTVSSLLAPLGKSALDDPYQQIAQSGIATGRSKPNEQPILGTLLSSATAAGAPFLTSKLTTGNWLGQSGNNLTPEEQAWLNGGGGASSGGPPPGVTVNEDGNLVNADGTLWTGADGSGGAGGTGGTGGTGSSPTSSLLTQLFGNNPMSSILQSAGLITNGFLQSGALRNAAGLQSQAAQNAAGLESRTAQQVLDFAKQIYGNEQGANAPFLQAGQNALKQIQDLIAPGGSLSQPFVPPGGAPSANFTMPTTEDVRKTPGYQLELGEAMNALNAQTRGVTSGTTVKAAEEFATNFADTKYQDAVNRALQGFQANQGAYQNQFGNALTTFQTNRSNALAPLMTLAGFGPQAIAANTQAGGQVLGTTANVADTSAQNIGNLLQQSAAAQAAGNVGATNAIGNTITGLGNIFSSNNILNSIMPLIMGQNFNPQLLQQLRQGS